MLAVIRLSPFDTTLPEGRSHERYRRAALTSLASLLAIEALPRQACRLQLNA